MTLGARLLLLVLFCTATPAGDESLYYVEKEGRLVFTNTPQQAARPVPGFEAPRAMTDFSALPATIYDSFIERVADEYRLSPALIKAVALVESGFDPHAVSPKGAGGLMQLMPGTAEQHGVQDVFDPLQNLRGGARHLRLLLDQFDGNLTLALAAYNAGAGAVRRHGGVPDYAETQEYVRRVRERLGDAPVRPPPPVRGSEGGRSGVRSYEDVQLLRASDGSVLLTN